MALQDLQKILDQAKEIKSFTKESITQLQTYISNNKLQKLSLWQMNSSMSSLMKMAKYQTVIIAAVGLIAFPYIMYERYQENPERLTTIAIVTPLACGALFAPFFIHRKISSKMLKEITYDVTGNQFILKRFKSGKQTFVSPSSLHVGWTNNGRVKDIKVQNLNKPVENYNIEGIGSWSSLELFKHIHEKKNL